VGIGGIGDGVLAALIWGTHRPALAAASGSTRALITEMLCRPNARWICGEGQPRRCVK